MQKKQILNRVLVVAGLGLAHAAGAQVASAPAAAAAAPAALAAPAAVVPVQSLTLGDLADLARDAEFEKQRRALREAKGTTEVKPAAPVPVPAPVKKKVKVPPKPIEPEGLQVRAIFGMPRSETVRFFTNKGKFEDHHVGDSVQGWEIIQVADDGVVLQKGKVIYPLALQTLRMAPESADGAEPEPPVRNAVQAGPLPSPKLASGQ